MVLQILLIISIVLQLLAAGTAIGLTRVTRYNLSWVLFTVALTALTVTRCGEYIQLVGSKELRLPPDFFIWIGVLTSLCFAVGVFYVKKIFNYINKLESRRQLTEKRILNTVLRTEEKERLRFSKELHDGLGPLLSSAKMSLSALGKSQQTTESREIIENTAYVIEEAIRSLREISTNLSPQVLNDFGLARGLQHFINKVPVLNDLEGGSKAGRDNIKIKINFTTNLKGERFNTDIEVILYRVVCELINNSIKHSGGTEINLTLLYNDQTLSLAYSDNGKGFDLPAVLDVGMGLSNITSRIQSLKGVCNIRSEKGAGMHASIRIDLSKTQSWR